ncbi:hypothetical protein RYX36_030683 [Vicia faba]
MLSYDKQDFQSNYTLTTDDVPFSDNFFVKDNLLQGNGLSWVLPDMDHKMDMDDQRESQIMMEKKLEPEVTDGVCKAVVPLPELLASRIEAELFILPFKPPSSHLSCSLPLRFTRTICTLQHLQHKQPQTSQTVIGILEERGLLDSITNDALRSI